MAEAHHAVHLLEDKLHPNLVYDDEEFLTIRINKALAKQIVRYVQVCTRIE